MNHRLVARRWCFLVLSMALSACGSGNTTGTTSSNAPPAAAGCTSTGATSAITLSATAGRLSGVAPLGVFLDATGTTGSSTATPFHDLEYRWNFGDSLSGNWTNGARPNEISRNLAKGPTAAHVYERAGTYTVDLQVTDGVNTARNQCIEITVNDPEVVFAGSNTICFSNGATFSGCPAGATQVSNSTNFTGVTALAATGKRLLLERGGAWTAASPGLIAVDGPGTLGAYGTGAQPIITATANINILNLDTPGLPTLKDWRIMDVTFDGSPEGNVGNVTRGIALNGGSAQITLLRITTQDLHYGIFGDSFTLDFFNAGSHPGNDVWDQFVIADSSFHRAKGGSGGYLVFLSAERYAFLGNLADDSTLAEHILRHPYLGKAVISNNTLSNTAAGKHLLKLHGPKSGSTGIDRTSSNGYTEQVVISDNKFVGGTSDITVAIQPQNTVENEAIRDVIVERNWYTSGPATQFALAVSATQVTVRNEICDLTGAAFFTCFKVIRRGAEPPPTDVRLRNNTCFSGSISGSGFGCVDLAISASNITAQNNLLWAPGHPGAPQSNVVKDAGAGGVNTFQTNTMSVGTTPFVSASPTVLADFRLVAALPGTTIPVFSDFFDASRLRNGAFDQGAIEFCPGGTCLP